MNKNMTYKNFEMLNWLKIPYYERKFDDNNIYNIFSTEEIEQYCIKKITTLAIMSDLEPSSIPLPDHLHIIMVSVKDVHFNKYLYNIFKKVTAFFGAICLVVFEKNGAIKLGACENVIFKKPFPIFGEIILTQWFYEDYIPRNVYEFFCEFEKKINSEQNVGDIYYDLYELFQTIQSEYISEEQVKGQMYIHYRNLSKSPLFQDFVLSTSFKTLRHTKGYAPRLRYEKSSVFRACETFEFYS